MLKTLPESRTNMLDLESCVKKADNNRYDLVLIASECARDIKRKHRESGEYKTCVDALLEVQAGRYTRQDYYKSIKD
jgi:DNA-directed RNA polymerase subunit K/omega